MNTVVAIGDRRVGVGEPVFIIAEAGVNHNGDPDMARKLVDAAAEAGADCVKFQTFRTDEFFADRGQTYTYSSAEGPKTERLGEMFRRLELPPEWHRELFERAWQRGLIPLSSVADQQSAEIVEQAGAPAFKVASDDMVNFPLLAYLATRRKPVILSTGMADLDEVERAVEVLRPVPVIMLHCVSLYPTPDEEANLKRMVALRERFHLPVGFSDHTLGITAALGAVALGAVTIEKHFTLSRQLPGPDHALSADPEEFTQLVREVRRLERMLGAGSLAPGQRQAEARKEMRRTIVATQAVAPGATLTREMVALKRAAGGGPSPLLLEQLLGRRVRASLHPGEVVTPEKLEAPSS